MQKGIDKPEIRLTAKAQAALAERWAEKALAVYPADTVRIFLSAKNRFSNPVGSAIRRNLERLLEIIVSGEELDNAVEALDEIIRIRSVQELTASESIRFVFELKDVFREGEASVPDLHAAVEWLHDRIEKLALRAFDTYVGCREDVYRVRANQQQAYARKLIERAERIVHGPLDDAPTDPKSEDNGMIQRGERP